MHRGLQIRETPGQAVPQVKVDRQVLHEPWPLRTQERSRIECPACVIDRGFYILGFPGRVEPSLQIKRQVPRTTAIVAVPRRRGRYRPLVSLHHGVERGWCRIPTVLLLRSLGTFRLDVPA